MRFLGLFFLTLVFPLQMNGKEPTDVVSIVKPFPYSVAGFSALSNGEGVRNLYDMNPGWKFFKGEVKGAEDAGFDDTKWETVNLPHGLEVLPAEASGCSNYQGAAWYRKTLLIPNQLDKKKTTLYFESIMGKSSIWVNGKLVKENEGGFLPVIVDLSDVLKIGEPNVIAVRADNSNDASYPPGKPQEMLDFSYFGGIYRDVYLKGTGKIYITDPNEANTVAGGGVFFRTDSLTNEGGEAKASAKVQIANDTNQEQKLTIHASLTYPGDLDPSTVSQPLVLAPGAKGEVELPFVLKKAKLWSPENPRLYKLSVNVYQGGVKGKSATLLDACTLNVGLRTFSFSDKGFVLNGKPYEEKLLGANRHQDFATLGNAVPNNLQWRDAVKLRDAGMKVIRCAHYPMDPAFMDACDRIGLFVIVATPGWQFWGKGNFGEKVEKDVRQMVRRDRNRPSVLMWEPILNETHYPVEFAKKMYDAVHEEYPYPSCYAACDTIARGMEHYDVLYAHPSGKNDHYGKPFFTREYGDYVDSWNSHNSPSRVSRNWGEIPMLVQAEHYLKPVYSTTSVNLLQRAPMYHFGGCLWHPFDHQRGYHPDPFYGGIFDAYRQPKTAFYAYKSQRSPKGEGKYVPGKGPFIYIANECTPFSPEDVTVYSNCDLVRLTVNEKQVMEKTPDREKSHLPHPPLVFEKAWDNVENKRLTRKAEEKNQVKLVAEGFIDGKLVARHEVRPARRPEQIRLALDDPNFIPEANGSDVVEIIASMTDRDGNVKRLNNERIIFEIEGPGTIVGNAQSGANPRAVEWGTAPLLVRMGTKPGKISIKASVLYPGQQKPIEGKIDFSSVPSTRLMLDRVVLSETQPEGATTEKTKESAAHTAKEEELKKEVDLLKKELNDLRIREVERQQADFQ